MKYIEFMGAYSRIDDSGGREYKPIGAISIAPQYVVAFCNHTIHTPANKITIMETYDEIKAKLEKE